MAETLTTSRPELGLADDTMSQLAGIFKTLLADEYVLYTKARNYHWNVTGPQFIALHRFFEELYTALETVIDEVAERIRQYGQMAPGTMAEFLQLARLKEEAPATYPNAREMVVRLLADYEALVRYLREDIEKIDDDYEDDGAEDYLTTLLQQHQKTAWMLRSLLEGGSL